MRALRAMRLRLHAAQEGIAMVMVIGVGSVMMLLIVSAVALSLGSQNKADNDQDWNGALAAAFAGLEEYQSRLAEEPGYVAYGNPASDFSNPTHSATTTVSLPTTVNPAFGVGASGTWAEAKLNVNGTLVTQFAYRYEVDNSKYQSTGTIRLRSTGKVGGQTRSVVADVRQTGFIDYVYFTDLEFTDPAISNSTCASVHMWEGRNTSCTIQFGPSDLLTGPVHSNDTLYICGSHFKATVTTGKPGAGYVRPSGCSLPTFDVGAPVYSPSIPMPATNSELVKETRTDAAAGVERPGCLYTGPTSITFITGGQMTVKSPWTKKTNISNAAGTTGTVNASQCGSIAALQSAAGATVPVPENNVIYVQNIPLTGDLSSTAAATTTTGSNQRCKTPAGASLTTTAGYSQNVVGYPRATEVPPVVGTGATASYGCRNGDLFVSGTNSGGPVTLAAQNYVYVTDNLRDDNRDVDMIGIVGQNAVWVYNPMNSSNTFLLPSNRTIDAAILSVAHTFTVQNYDEGSTRGTLTVYGSIAQKYRGPVGTSGGSGYLKSYTYDPRFKFTAPPKFLAPVTTTYGINVWVEISPVYNTNGTYR